MSELGGERERDVLVALSHEFGGAEYVKGGGGNTSVKTRETLWIKPSGTSLAELTPDRLVAIDRTKLARLYQYAPPKDAAQRERDVLALMSDACLPGQSGRPSVETPLHDMLEATYVVHTHAELINGLTCGRHGAVEAARLFPDALWVPYIDPGFTLSVDVRSRVQDYVRKHGRQPSIILLENHGVFVGGNTPEEVRALYAQLLETMREAYARAGIPVTLRYGSPTLDEELPVLADLARKWLGPAAAHVETSAPFAVVQGPLTPDHMVYAKAHPYNEEINEEGLAAFQKKHGYTPRILVTKAAVIALGRTAKAAKLAMDLARDGALIQQLAGAFGGVQFMTDAARAFIESWEVESYREQLSQKSSTS